MSVTFGIHFQTKKDEGQLKPGAKVSVYKDIAGEAERLDIKENKAVMVLVELLLDENIIKQVSSHASCFKITRKHVLSSQQIVLHRMTLRFCLSLEMGLA